MYFDEAVNIYENGAGTMIISPDKKQFPVSVKLQFECTNNTTEYEACDTIKELMFYLKCRSV
jgi:ribonuclease HI